MIRLITGVTRVGSRVYRPESGAFEAGKEVEANLVKRGVAKYVNATDTNVGNIEAPAEGTPVIAAEAPSDAPDIKAEAPTKKPAAKKPAGKKS